LGPCFELDVSTKEKVIEINLFVFDRYQFGNEMGFLLDEQRFDATRWSLSNGGPKLQKWTISLDATTNTATMKAERRGNNIVSDMPTFHPDRDGLPCRFVYTVCGIRQQGFFPWNAIAKHDLQKNTISIWPPEASTLANNDTDSNWDGGPGVYSEPLFVPRQSSSCREWKEDAGFLLCTLHNALEETTILEIFDAEAFSNGPIQQVDLGELWGWNVHSSFEQHEY